MKRIKLSRATLVYCILFVVGAAIVLHHPTGNGLAALLLFLPGILVSLTFPARTKGMRA
jgi:hypothetical protein